VQERVYSSGTCNRKRGESISLLEKVIFTGSEDRYELDFQT